MISGAVKTCSMLMLSQQPCIDCELYGIARSALQATQALPSLSAAFARFMAG